jgi:hypothetical protein
MFARQPAVVGVVAHREEALAREHEPLPRQRRDRAAEHGLAFAEPVDVGGVEQVDAQLERVGDQPSGRFAVDRAAEREPGAEPDGADLEPGATEVAVLHARRGCTQQGRATPRPPGRVAQSGSAVG